MESFDRLPHVASLAMRNSLNSPDDLALKMEAASQLAASLRLGDITLTEHIQFYRILSGIRDPESVPMQEEVVVVLDEAADTVAIPSRDDTERPPLRIAG